MPDTVFVVFAVIALILGAGIVYILLERKGSVSADLAAAKTDLSTGLTNLESRITALLHVQHASVTAKIAALPAIPVNQPAPVPVALPTPGGQPAAIAPAPVIRSADVAAPAPAPAPAPAATSYVWSDDSVHSIPQTIPPADLAALNTFAQQTQDAQNGIWRGILPTALIVLLPSRLVTSADLAILNTFAQQINDVLAAVARGVTPPAVGITPLPARLASSNSSASPIVDAVMAAQQSAGVVKS